MIQVDVEPRRDRRATGRSTLGIVGDAALTARALTARARADRRGARAGWRSAELARADRGRALARRALRRRRAPTSYIDPRTLSIALNDAAARRPRRRRRLGPLHSATRRCYLDVPDAALVAVRQRLPGRRPRPRQRDRRRGRAARTGSRSPRSATAARSWRWPSSRPRRASGLRLLVVIYDDAAYGAEVHHFGPLGHDVSPACASPTPTSPRSPAPPARGRSPCAASTTSTPVADWLADAAAGPLVVDAKVNPDDLRGVARGGVPRRLTIHRPRSSTMSTTAVTDLVAGARRRLRRRRRPDPAAERDDAGARAARAVRQHAASVAAHAEPATTTRARRGPGTCSSSASTPARTSTRRSTGSPARDGEDVASIAPARLVGPAVVIDKTRRDRRRPRLPADRRPTSRRFEAEHGEIPPGAWVLLPHRLGRARRTTRRRS